MKAIRVTTMNGWMSATLAEKYRVERDRLPLKWWQRKPRYVVTIPVYEWDGRDGLEVQLSILRAAKAASWAVADFSMELIKDYKLTPVN